LRVPVDPLVRSIRRNLRFGAAPRSYPALPRGSLNRWSPALEQCSITRRARQNIGFIGDPPWHRACPFREAAGRNAEADDGGQHEHASEISRTPRRARADRGDGRSRIAPRKWGPARGARPGTWNRKPPPRLRGEPGAGRFTGQLPRAG